MPRLQEVRYLVEVVLRVPRENEPPETQDISTTIREALEDWDSYQVARVETELN